MAKKTKKERETEVLEYRLAKEAKLIATWEKYGIPQNKIDMLKAKKEKHQEKLDKIKN